MHIDNSSIESDKFTLRWDAPKNPRGLIKQYKIFIKFNKYAYANPPYCPQNPNEKEFNETIFDVDNRAFTYKTATPYSTYFVQIQASNGESKEGEWSANTAVTTLPGNFIML